MHHHPNNFLSGVYYVRTHPGADTINFHDPRNQSGIIRPPVVELTAENTDQVVVRVKDGTMLVFPAYLQHSVDANASDFMTCCSPPRPLTLPRNDPPIALERSQRASAIDIARTRWSWIAYLFRNARWIRLLT